jgi:hypothetical protein
VRLRLAAIYTGVFLVVGIALIAITYSLLSQQLNAFAPPGLQTLFVLRPGQGAELNAQLNEVVAHQRAVTLHQLVVQAAIARFTLALGLPHRRPPSLSCNTPWAAACSSCTGRTS